MTSIEFLGTQAGANKWQRLAPAAIIYFAIRFLVQIAKQGVQGLVPLAAVAVTAGENRWFIIGLIAVAAVTALLVGAFLSFLKFRFRLSDDTVLIQSGVLKRKRLTLSYSRIQNIVFKQPIYFRPFGLVVLGIESAGSSSEEVSLGGIPRALAEEIRTSVFTRKSNLAPNNIDTQNEDAADIPADDAVTEEVIRQPLSELVRYGLSNSQIWVFASLGAALAAQIEWDDYEVLSGLQGQLNALAEQGQFIAAMIAVSGIILSIVLLLGISVIGAIITYYDYHLTWSGGRFHRTRGLFERHETSLPEIKIQSLVIRQSWPARVLNRFHIQLKQVGFSGPGGGQPGMQGGNSKLLVPSVTNVFVQKFSRMVYPEFDWSLGKLKKIHRAYTHRIVLWIMMPIAVIPAIIMSFALSPAALAVTALPLLLAPAVMLRRARYGYATDGIYGIVRSGFIGHRLTLFPFYKVQTVQLWQSPGQRKKRLASLTIKLAGTSLEIPYMALEDAEQWRDTILFQIESRNETWM